MISSLMKDRVSDRAAIARIIREEQAIPWYADDPPHEFRGVSPEDISFEMARNCDLYLLIIFPQYGTQVSADDSRSVTHQEFAAARAENPQKVEAFIAIQAFAVAEEGKAPGAAGIRALIEEARHFRKGYNAHVFNNLEELLELVRATMHGWE